MLLVVDNQSRFVEDLAVRLRELGGDCVVRPANQPIPHEELRRAEGIILSGGPLLLDRELVLQTIVLDFEVLLEARAPILGICLGLQLIAEMHGSGLARCPEPVNREVSVKVLKKDPLFDGLATTFTAWAAHSEVIASLPGTFEHLASSDDCYYAAMRHRERPRYGVQFHPEVSGGAGRQILANFLDICWRAPQNSTPPGRPASSHSGDRFR